MILCFQDGDESIIVPSIGDSARCGDTLVFFAPDDDEKRWAGGPFAGRGPLWLFEVLRTDGDTLLLRDHGSTRFELSRRGNPELIERLYWYTDLESALRRQAKSDQAKLAALRGRYDSTTTHHSQIRSAYALLVPGFNA